MTPVNLLDTEYFDLDVAVSKVFGARSEFHAELVWRPTSSREETRYDVWAINDDEQGRATGPHDTEAAAWRAYLNRDRSGSNHHCVTDPERRCEVLDALINGVGAVVLISLGSTSPMRRVYLKNDTLLGEGRSNAEALARALVKACEKWPSTAEYLKPTSGTGG